MLHPSCRFSPRLGFTLVELLVVIAIIGLLVSLLFPAVQSAREAARATQCKNHLRQLGLATVVFHEANGMFPPSRLRARVEVEEDNCETTQPSWLVRVLPYLEESPMYEQWDLSAPFELHPAVVREFVPSVYVCPTRRTVDKAVIPSSSIQQLVFYACGCFFMEEIQLTGGAIGDYGGNHGDFTGGSDSEEFSYWRGGNGTGVIISARPVCQNGKPIGWRDKIRYKDLKDGASKTALAGEMHVPLRRLAQPPENGPIYNGKDLPAFGRIGGPGIPLARGAHDESTPALGFGSWHPGVVPFVMADGSVRSVDNFVDVRVLRSLCHRADGDAAAAAL